MTFEPNALEVNKVTIDGVTFTRDSIQEQWSSEDLAIIWCGLNAKRTPKKLGIGRVLTESEGRKMFRLFAGVVPKREWLPTWQNKKLWNKDYEGFDAEIEAIERGE